MTLVTVLLALALLSVMAAGLIVSARSSVREARTGADRAEARALAEAALVDTALRLLNADERRQFPIDGEIVGREVLGVDVLVQVEDEAGKVDLNLADLATLENLFVWAGLDPASGLSVAENVVDWRDEDTHDRGDRPEAEAYTAAGLPYTQSNRAFIAADEFRQVLGVDKALFRRCALTSPCMATDRLPISGQRGSRRLRLQGFWMIPRCAASLPHAVQIRSKLVNAMDPVFIRYVSRRPAGVGPYSCVWP